MLSFSFLARHCSAKEVIIATQEAVERLRADALEEENDDESESVPLAVQLMRLLSLLSKSEYICPQSIQRVN